MAIQNWTIEDLRKEISNSISFRSLLPKLGLKYSGSNSIRIKAICIEHGIDFTHFQLKILPNNAKPIEELLNSNNTSSANLRKRLIKENIFEHKCMSCNLRKWLNQPVPLELHHIDGNRKNNNLVNLQLLCPNCHAFTSNYRGKNKPKRT